MAPPTNSVNFWSPQSIIAPDLTVQEQQIERQRAIADALRSQSLQSDVPQRGAVSWTQGAAKLAQALSANIIQRRADKKQMTLNQAYAQRMGGMFGSGPNPNGTMSAKGGDPVSGGGAVPDGSGAAPPIVSVDPDAAATGDLMPPPAPQQAPQPQPPQEGPLSLSGNPGQDMAMYSMGPEEYVKAVIAKHAPTDFNKLLLQSGIDPNSPLGRQVMQAQIAKQNYIAPINGRPGSTIRDPNDPSRILGYDAPSIEGAFPVYGPNGMPAGYQQAPGAAAAIGAASGAKAGATAAAQAPFDLVEVVDASGAKHMIPKSTLTGGQGAAAGGGGLNGYYGGRGTPVGNQSSLGPGQQAGATQAGQQSAKAFQEAVDGGNTARDANRQLDLILQAADGLPTGRGAAAVSGVKSAYNTVVDASGLGGVLPKANQETIARYNEMEKLSASLAQAASGGATGTDARLHNALKAIPNSGYAPTAIKNVGFMLKGLQSAALERSQAAAAWQQTHGPDSYPAFQAEWNKAYDPELFEAIQRDKAQPGVFQSWFKQVPAARRADVTDRLKRLKALGVTMQ